MRVLSTLACALALSGCAGLHSKPVQDAVGGPDALSVGAAVADYIAGVLPPAASTIRLEAPAAQLEASAQVDAAVAAALRDRGYAVAEGGDGLVGHALGIAASPFEDGVIVQLVLDGEPAARLLRRDAAGALSAWSPVTVQRRQP